MDRGHINLKCSDLRANVFSSFNTLQGSDLFTDVTLVSDDNKKVQAHKLILSAGSEFFRDILSDKSHPHPMLCLDGISSENLEWILKYLYFGEVSVPHSSLQKFLKIANKYKCFGLKEEEPQQLEEEKTDSKALDNEIIKICRNNEEQVSEPLFEDKQSILADNRISDTGNESTFHKENEDVEIVEDSKHESDDKEISYIEKDDEGENSEPAFEDDKSVVTETDIVDNRNEEALIIENEEVKNDVLTDLKEVKTILEKKKNKPLFEFCRIDGKTISKNDLYEYLKEHYHRRPDKIYKCNYCEHTSRLKDKLMEHVQRHLTNLEFDCEICGKNLPTTKALRGHKYSKHEHAKRKKKGRKSVHKEYKDRIFINQIILDEKNVVAKTQTSVSPEQITDQLCTTSKLEAQPAQAGRLKEHWTDFFTFNKPQESIVCNICNTHFKSQSSANIHYKTTHLGMRFPCHYCNHMATTKYLRRRHIRTKHLNEEFLKP